MDNFKITDKNRELQYRNMMDAINIYNAGIQKDKSSLKTTKMRSLMNAYRLSEAYKNNTKVAYVGEQFPNEIVLAFNLNAWNIESMAILFSQSINTDRFFNLTQENNLSRDICSFLRGPFGVMLSNSYPTPDIALANDQPCDCLAKLVNMASKIYGCPFYTLNTPNYINEDALLYLVNQMKYLISEIESKLNIKFEQEQFNKVIAYSNEARSYYCKIVELHRRATLPGVSRELLEVFGMNYFGVKETVQICKTLYQEALEMSKQSENTKKKRVLWVGQVPEGSHDLLDYLDDFVEVVFWPSLWESNLMILDPEEPLKSIAHRAILYHWNSERMRINIEDICKKFEIEGIIICNIWGCRNNLGLSSMIREFSREQNLKCLTLGLDLMDRNNYSFAYVKNRVDAFLEIILKVI